MMLAATPVTLAIIAYSLLVRRMTWGSSWEADATTCVTLQGCGVALMSPWAAQTVSAPAHSIIGVWNIATLAGHLCMLFAVSALIHHVLTRLASDSQLTELFVHRVVEPLKFAVPALVMLFVLADRGHQPEYLSVPVLSPWHGLYWLLLLGTAMYLLAYAIRLLRVARRDERSRPTVDIYIVAIAFDVIGCGIQFGALWLRLDAAVAVWVCLCAGAAAFAYGAAQSWQAKVTWFDSDHEPPAQPLAPGSLS